MRDKFSSLVGTFAMNTIFGFIISLHVATVIQIISIVRNLAINNWNNYKMMLFDINVILVLLMVEYLAVFIVISIIRNEYRKL
ncbi:MAG: hypothetical protein KJ592_05215 [Nanoarchaeota archaeon]|nr:hypothetical protein [Nanoarchaeota archaeon]